MNRGAQNRSRDIEILASNWILRRDAGLSSAEEAEFQRWQTEDPRHADALARKAGTWTTLGRPLHSGQADLLLRHLQARAMKRRRHRVTLAAAGIVVLLIAASFLQVGRIVAPASPESQGGRPFA